MALSKQCSVWAAHVISPVYSNSSWRSSGKRQWVECLETIIIWSRNYSVIYSHLIINHFNGLLASIICCLICPCLRSHLWVWMFQQEPDTTLWIIFCGFSDISCVHTLQWLVWANNENIAHIYNIPLHICKLFWFDSEHMKL